MALTTLICFECDHAEPDSGQVPTCPICGGSMEAVVFT